MLPKPEAFSSAVRKLGIGDGKHVICYDAAGLFSAARVWWMFNVFGHSDVAVLDGGLPKWLAEGRPVEDGPARMAQERHFTARYKAMMVADKAAVRGARQVVDARSPTRFRGEEPEPRPGVQPGHIPGSHNLHYARLLRADGTLKPPQELQQLFAEAGIDSQQPVITSCGSGITAAILSLALTQIGARQHALYDGSWADWGAAPDTIKATGPAKPGQAPEA
jgi:thiosulfate/3-mercaptopyruvate sulfurtransferase